MSKRYCKYQCEFLTQLPDEEPKCLIYKKKIKMDNEGYVRLKKCVRESREWKINAQIDDIRTFYDAFICEMDMMFDNLNRLIKGENKNDK